MQPLNGNVKMERLYEFGFDIVFFENGKCFVVPEDGEFALTIIAMLIKRRYVALLCWPPIGFTQESRQASIDKIEVTYHHYPFSQLQYLLFSYLLNLFKTKLDCN